jgi:hypothetical protein
LLTPEERQAREIEERANVQHFDVVVVGSEIAGLTAGALLAKGGMRVLHLDVAPARSSYRVGDLLFHRQLRLFSSWDSSPAQKRAFFDLNLITDMSRRLTPLQPAFQLVLPDHRLDVTPEPAALAQEIEREFPGSGAHTEEALRRIEELNAGLDKLLDGRVMLPPDGWRERRELHRALEEHPAPEEADAVLNGLPSDHPIRRAAEVMLPFITHLDTSTPSPIRLARAARQIQLGVCDLPGGLGELKERLSGVIRHFHGDARSEGIAETTVSWGRIKSFRLSGGEVVGCEQVLGAEPVDRLFEALGDKSLRKWHDHVASELRPAMRVYTLNLVLKSEGVPEGMGPLGFIVRNPGAPLALDNLLLWSLQGSGDTRGLTAACVVPQADTRDAGFWRDIKTKVLEGLEEVMPFHRRHLVRVDVPWEDGGSGGDEVRPLREMSELYAFDGQSALGIGAVPYRTPLKNLTLANRQILPGLGLEGEFLAGAAAARLLHSPKDKRSWYE